MWPENWPAVEVFSRLTGSWRVGPAGAYGLDLALAFQLFPLLGIKKKDWLSLVDDLRVMESAALDEINKKRKA